MVRVKYKYMYMNKRKEVKEGSFSLEAASFSCDEVHNKVEETIEKVRKRGDIFIQGRFLPTKIIKSHFPVS